MASPLVFSCDGSCSDYPYRIGFTSAACKLGSNNKIADKRLWATKHGGKGPQAAELIGIYLALDMIWYDQEAQNNGTCDIMSDSWNCIQWINHKVDAGRFSALVEICKDMLEVIKDEKQIDVKLRFWPREDNTVANDLAHDLFNDMKRHLWDPQLWNKETKTCVDCLEFMSLGLDVEEALAAAEFTDAEYIPIDALPIQQLVDIPSPPTRPTPMIHDIGDGDEDAIVTHFYNIGELDEDNQLADIDVW